MVRILAATDFSEEGMPVLDFAAGMVRQCGGKMYLLHVVEPCALNAAGVLTAADIGFYLPDGMLQSTDEECAGRQLLAAADARAKKLAEDIRKRVGIPIYGKAEQADDIVECVHAFCERHHVDMLVIGNRHHSLLTSILLGNTAEQLMRAAKIPVTVVPCAPSITR